MSSAKPLIFISYAHADEPAKPRMEWLTFVMKYLRPAVKQGEFEVWTDRELEGGANWEERIERNLYDCDIFILLVSPNSISSNFSSSIKKFGSPANAWPQVMICTSIRWSSNQLRTRVLKNSGTSIFGRATESPFLDFRLLAVWST